MKIALLGYGKMGKTLHNLLDENQNHRVILKVNSANASELTLNLLSKADAAIEFSTPDTALENIYRCFEADIPVVVGTTGWLNHFEEVKARCLKEKKAMLYAANFSIGVNLFFKLNKMMNELMYKHNNYEVDISEIHHTEKKDAPSGTAIHLANDIISAHPIKNKWINELNEDETALSILSKREKEVKGLHTVKWQSEHDALTIKHEAFNRTGFAKGAIIAAEWIAGKTGFFSMEDVLK